MYNIIANIQIQIREKYITIRKQRLVTKVGRYGNYYFRSRICLIFLLGKSKVMQVIPSETAAIV